MNCADYDPLKELIRCPVVRCNDNSNRMLFQLLSPLMDTVCSERWEDYLSDLPKREAERKSIHQITLAMDLERDGPRCDRV